MAKEARQNVQMGNPVGPEQHNVGLNPEEQASEASSDR